MSKPQFVYVIYIKAAPEKVWNGLLDPAMTRIYWMHENVSDWKPGSRWEHRRTDPHGTVDIVGEVVEFDPPKRLVHSWTSMYNPETAKEPASRVTWEIEPQDTGTCLLTLTHDRLERSPLTAVGVFGSGWMHVVSGLKTLLETGQPMDDDV